MQKIQKIAWKPFSKKHKRYIKNALSNKMNVAEGAIRSGKTIDHCIIASMYLETCHDKIHLASGSTIGNAKLNIGDCNGFGLEHIFRGRCRWGKYKDNEALFVQTKTGEKVVIFAGGGKADSYKRILGNSYGMWIATEINEHYDSDDSRTSFIKVAFGRQVAAQKPLVLWDLNPCSPNHRIYKNYIDLYKKQYIGGYQYQHFTINDNLSITKERRKEIESQYVVGSIWYRRDILGERCIAEGLVFSKWEQAIGEPPKESTAEQYVLSIDYGTQNAFAAGLWEKHGDIWYMTKEYYYSGREEHRQKEDSEYVNDLNVFISPIIGKVKGKIKTIVDPSAASFKVALRNSANNWYKAIDADNAVNDGIREVNSAIDLGLIKVSDSCVNWKEEAGGYIWDTKQDVDKPVKIDDHLCDQTRYFVKTMRIVPKALKERRNIARGSLFA